VVVWEFSSRTAIFTLDACPIVTALLGKHKAEKYHVLKRKWMPLGINESFPVVDLDIILVRAVGVKHGPRQLQLEAAVNAKYREAQLLYVFCSIQANSLAEQTPLVHFQTTMTQSRRGRYHNTGMPVFQPYNYTTQ
jgi:hypothetical protein